MTNYFALLRGINVSGQKKILMKELRSMCEALGLKQVQTYVQSGNIVFASPEEDTRLLEARLVEAIHAHFAFEVPTLVRRLSYLEQVIAGNPYRELTAQDAKQPYVLFLDHPPEPSHVEAFVPPEGETARCVIVEQQVYIGYPQGSGRSKLTTNYLERKLKVTATMRNWKTVLALQMLLDR